MQIYDTKVNIRLQNFRITQLKKKLAAVSQSITECMEDWVLQSHLQKLQSQWEILEEAHMSLIGKEDFFEVYLYFKEKKFEEIEDEYETTTFQLLSQIHKKSSYPTQPPQLRTVPPKILETASRVTTTIPQNLETHQFKSLPNHYIQPQTQYCRYCKKTDHDIYECNVLFKTTNHDALEKCNSYSLEYFSGKQHNSMIHTENENNKFSKPHRNNTCLQNNRLQYESKPGYKTNLHVSSSKPKIDTKEATLLATGIVEATTYVEHNEPKQLEEIQETTTATDIENQTFTITTTTLPQHETRKTKNPINNHILEKSIEIHTVSDDVKQKSASTGDTQIINVNTIILLPSIDLHDTITSAGRRRCNTIRTARANNKENKCRQNKLPEQLMNWLFCLYIFLHRMTIASSNYALILCVSNFSRSTPRDRPPPHPGPVPAKSAPPKPKTTCCRSTTPGPTTWTEPRDDGNLPIPAA